MENPCGVYVSELPDGTIKRDLVRDSGKVPLEDSTVLKELLLFSELDYEPYEKTADVIVFLISYLGAAEDMPHDELSSKILSAISSLAEGLVQQYEIDVPVFGALLQMALEDQIPRDIEASQSIRRIGLNIQALLYDTFFFGHCLYMALEDYCLKGQIDFEGKYAQFRQTEVTQTLTMGKSLETQYFFRSPVSYYQFLLFRFVERGARIAQCQLCRGFFIPSRKDELYCNRLIADGKTCKQFGPEFFHMFNAEGTITEEYDRARRRMYKRYERALDVNKKPSEKDLTADEYYAWLDRASQAKTDCEAGRITFEQAIEIIDVP